MALTLSEEVAAVMRAQHGIVTVDQLRESGFSDAQRRRLVRNHVLSPVHHNVLRSTASLADFRSNCLAAALAVPRSAISGPAGGVLFGLRKLSRHSDVHLMTARRGVRLDGVVVHLSNAFGPGDVRTVGGIPVLAPVRLAPDLARFVSDDDLASIIEQMLDRSLVSMPALFAMARRLSVSGRDGIQRFVRVINSRPAWQRPAGSDLERRFIDELRRRGLDLKRQVRVDFPDGGYADLDGADPALRIAVEVDHVTWHGGRVESQADKRRDRRLLGLGWTTVRVTDDDVEHRFHETADEVEVLLRAAPAA